MTREEKIEAIGNSILYIQRHRVVCGYVVGDIASSNIYRIAYRESSARERNIVLIFDNDVYQSLIAELDDLMRINNIIESVKNCLDFKRLEIWRWDLYSQIASWLNNGFKGYGQYHYDTRLSNNIDACFTNVEVIKGEAMDCRDFKLYVPLANFKEYIDNNRSSFGYESERMLLCNDLIADLEAKRLALKIADLFDYYKVWIDK